MMKWLHQALSDDSGQGDIAYGAIGLLTLAAVASLTFLFAMSAMAYFRCIPLVKADVVVNCIYDPLPAAQGTALIFGAFATLIGALVGYMAVTRKQRPQQGDQTVIARNIGQVGQPPLTDVMTRVDSGPPPLPSPQPPLRPRPRKAKRKRGR
jgi:hypothetical protein